MRRFLSASLSCIALLVLLAPPVLAAPAVQVDCASDPAALGTAIVAASPGARLVISGTCSDFLALDKDLTIVGGGPDATLVGDLFLGVLRVSPGVVVSLSHLTVHARVMSPGVQLSNDGTLTLDDVTISDGSAINAIRNTGTLTLLRSIITRNRGKGDAPIANRGGTVMIKRSQITDNGNTEVYGAIRNDTGGTMTLAASTISGNSGYVGGLYNAGTMTMRNSVFSGNSGGQAPLRNVGTMTVANSIVSANVAGDRAFCIERCAGGIQNEGILVVRGSVVRDNQGGQGGGIYNDGTMTLRTSSVVANTAAGNGGGVYNAAGGTADLRQIAIEQNGAGLDGGGIFNEGALTLQHASVRDNTPNDCTGC